MIQISWRKWFMALLLSSVAYFISVGAAAASHLAQSGVELDHLIPRAKWAGAGLDRLTAPEQQALADEITGLLGAARSAQSNAQTAKDRSQWRMLKKGMSKDEVRKLLGEPDRVTVSKLFETWSFGVGIVSFDGKGHVDFWSEP